MIFLPPLSNTIGNRFTHFSLLFATGFAGISDIEVSPYDGYMYVVSLGQGKIFRILPTDQGDTSASATPPPTAPAEPVPPILDDEDRVDTEGQDLTEQDDEENEVSEDNEDDQENENDEDDDDEQT